MQKKKEKSLKKFLEVFDFRRAGDVWRTGDWRKKERKGYLSVR